MRAWPSIPMAEDPVSKSGQCGFESHLGYVKFYATFGQKYRTERHPAYTWIHPDGWAVIEASDDQAARKIADATFGTEYAFIYSEEEWMKGTHTFFPGEELFRITE